MTEVTMTTEAMEARRAQMRARFGDAVVDAHTRSIRHRAEIEASASCGCFYCLHIFSHSEIREWVRDEGTALCPYCGTDAVLGSASGYEISVPFLTEMHEAWFGSAVPAEDLMTASEDDLTPIGATKAMTELTLNSNLDKEFAAVTELWSPRVVAIANGQYVKIAKVKGEFVWHTHAEEDEFFLVRKGTLTIRYRDRPDVALREGDFHVVPRGVEHMTAAPEECWVVLIEPAATKHTGDTASDMTKSIEAQTAHLWNA